MSQAQKISLVSYKTSNQESISLQFTEDMHGFFSTSTDSCESFAESSASAFKDAAKVGEKLNQALKFRLTIVVDDIHQFLNDPELTAKAEGYVDCPKLGGQLTVEKGVFNLFVRPTQSSIFDAAKEMHYTLYFTDDKGQPWTFYGYKVVEEQNGLDVWQQTTTLYTRLWQGHSISLPPGKKLWGQGVLTLNAHDFAKQMTTLKSNGKTLTDRVFAVSKFMEVFAENLWESYAPAIFDTATSRWNEHIFPVNTTRGVTEASISQHHFDTDDGLTLSVSRFKRSPCKDVVVLIHGLTTSTDMFIMPEHRNITQCLLDNGFTDVFSLDWRGSNRFIYNLKVHKYSVDDVAQYDIPKAIETIKGLVEPNTNIHVIAHCVGSIGLMTSLSAGKTTGITSVISNSVSLTPKIPWQARLKLMFAPWFVDKVLRYPYISPEISYLPGFRIVKLLPLMERAIRSECKEPACHMVSFMWGWGFPAAYEHKNLHPLTHRRLKDLFGGTSMNYFRHINRMVASGEAVPYTRSGVYEDLPKSYLQNAATIDLPPTLFVSGSNNLIFPDSNQTTYQKLKKLNKKAELEFESFDGYGHQDVFMGKNIEKDIFPRLLKFLNSHKKGGK